MKTIYFYSWEKDFFEFSNFSIHPIVVDGRKYKTNEHYFQSVKFIDERYQTKIQYSSTPKEAKKLGSSRHFQIREDWDEERIQVMKTAVRAKFTQHNNLRELLLSTKDAILVEKSPYDYFWGCGKNGTGKNMLGKILMEVREELRHE